MANNHSPLYLTNHYDCCIQCKSASLALKCQELIQEACLPITDFFQQEAKLYLKADASDRKLAIPYILGPSVEDAEGCAAFRKVWKSRAVVQQMPDASTILCVKWKKPTPLSGCPLNELSFTPSAFTQAITALLELNELEATLSTGFRMTDTALADPSSEERELRECIASFQSELTSLSAVPLIEVTSTSPATRGLSLPGTTEVELCVRLADEKRRWKQDKEWNRMARLACLLSLAQEVNKKRIAISTAILKAEEILEVEVERDFFQEQSSGQKGRKTVLFRIGVDGFSEFDPTKSFLTNALILPPKRSMSSESRMELKWLRRTIWASQHNSLLAASQNNHPAFVGTVRLFKIWYFNNWISSAPCEEFLELLVRGVFDATENEEAPIQTPSVGLFRVLLTIATHRWSSTPFFCGGADWTESKLSVQKAWDHPLDGQRPLFFLVTPFDYRAIYFEQPTLLQGNRLISLARTAVKEWISAEGIVDRSLALKLFTLDLEAMNGLIFLKDWRAEFLEDNANRKNLGRPIIKNLEKPSVLRSFIAESNRMGIHIKAESIMHKAFLLLLDQLKNEALNDEDYLLFYDPSTKPYPTVIGFVEREINKKSAPNAAKLEQKIKLALQELFDSVYVRDVKDNKQWKIVVRKEKLKYENALLFSREISQSNAK